MEIIVLLIGVSLSIAVGFLIIFIWNLRSGQYEDTYTPSVRMLIEDKKRKKESIGPISRKIPMDNETPEIII